MRHTTSALTKVTAQAGQFDSAIKTYRVLINDAPMGPSAPEFQQSIVRCHEGLRQRNQVRAEMKRMVELYRPGAAWYDRGEAKVVFDFTISDGRVARIDFRAAPEALAAVAPQVRGASRGNAWRARRRGGAGTVRPSAPVVGGYWMASRTRRHCWAWLPSAL